MIITSCSFACEKVTNLFLLNQETDVLMFLKTLELGDLQTTDTIRPT